VSGDHHDYTAIARDLKRYMREIQYEAGDTVIEVSCSAC
jgi:hypothetical protein